MLILPTRPTQPSPARPTFRWLRSTRPARAAEPVSRSPAHRNKLDSLADRLMYRLAYRNRGGIESLVVNHSVTVGTQAIGHQRPLVRDPQSQRNADRVPAGHAWHRDGIHRWMGSIAMDKQGNIALGYSASSGSVTPSIRYTGRLAT